MNQFLHQFRFRLLFVSNAVMCLVLGFGHEPRLLRQFSVMVFMLASINTLRHKHLLLSLAALVGVLNLALMALPVSDPHPALLREWLVLLSFYILITLALFHRVTRERPVTGELMYGLCAMYLQIALAFALSYALLAHTWPESFTDSTNAMVEGIDVLVYYSLATLTTVGYGDIHAMTPAARMLSAVEAFSGVMFIALAVARAQSLLDGDRDTD